MPRQLIDPTVGRVIKTYRTKFGMSRVELAEHLGVTHQQLAKYEQGVNHVAVESLYKLSKLFEIPMESFLKHEEIVPLNGPKGAIRNAFRTLTNLPEEKGKIVVSLINQLAGDKTDVVGAG